MTYMKFLPKV